MSHNPYHTSYIYKLVSDNAPELGCYVGSTIHPLHKRLYQHIAPTNKCTSRVIVDAGAPRMELLETCVCETRKQLCRREGYWQKQFPDCVNKQVAGRTEAEYAHDYYVANKDKIKAYKLEYDKKNAEVLRAKATAKVPCEYCGTCVSRNNIRVHQRSKKCQAVQQQCDDV